MGVFQAELYATYPQDPQRPMRLGLVGHTISHSFSPSLHNGWLKEKGIEGEYTLIDVPAFTPAILEQLIHGGYRGVNVTAPYKRLAAQYATHPDAIVRATGVANTLKFIGSQVHARNTDAEALLNLLRPHELNRAVVLGGGATAQTSVWVLRQLGCQHLTLLSRGGEANIEGVEVFALTDPQACEAISQAHVVINTLPPSAAIDFDFQTRLSEGLYVQWDYTQPPPPLSSNILIIKGMELLRAQGKLSFTFWMDE